MPAKKTVAKTVKLYEQDKYVSLSPQLQLWRKHRKVKMQPVKRWQQGLNKKLGIRRGKADGEYNKKDPPKFDDKRLFDTPSQSDDWESLLKGFKG